MREILLLILIFVVWISVLADRAKLENLVLPKSTKIEERWASSALSMHDLESAFSEESCFRTTGQQTHECLNGFNEAGALADPPQAIWPSEFAEDREIERIVARHGPVVHVELRSDAKSAIRTYRELLKRRFDLHRRLERAAFDLHHSRGRSHLSKSASELSFSRLLVEAHARVPKKFPEAMYVGAALSGKLAIRDPHSYVAPGAIFREWVTRSVVEKSGVGIVLHPVERGYRIYEVVSGSAAEQAGLKAYDLIRSIDGQDIDFRLNQDEITAKLSGPVGSKTVFTIERGPRRARKIERITVVRAKFKTKNAAMSFVREGDRIVSHLKIRSFLPNDVCTEVKSLIDRNERVGASGIVLDLRNNLGGSVDGAACVAGLFLGRDRLLVRTQSLVESSVEKKVSNVLTSHGQVTNLPMVILINEMSASAAEIVAGALRDHGRAVLLGERSFGKGTIQTLYDHRSDPSGTLVAVTEHGFILPSGETNQGYGLEPDLEVPFLASLSLADRWSAREGDLFPNAVVMRGKIRRPSANKRERLHACLVPLRRRLRETDRQLRAAVLTLGCEIDDAKLLAANP